MSNYLREVLGAERTVLNPNQPQGLVADIGPDIPGGEGANEGFWREQLRDRLGQFAKMLGTVLFDMEIEGIGRVTGHGELVKIVRPQVGVVRIKNHSILPDGDYEVPGDDLEAIDALIKDADYERVTGKELPKNKASELKDSITGDEALQKIYGQMGLHAKKSGRFAVGRSVKDVRDAAKETYKPVYEKLKDEYPELMTEFSDYESYWNYASNSLAAGVFTRWADSVDDIPELTKVSNKIYAREILGLKEDGFIEFYRNSVNHKSSPELAGAGYASLDRRMAWDYNSYLIKYADNGLNENDGRYIVKAKPDEVTGLLGISGAEDEYGVVIGLDVTSQPGRTTRVGDLEMQQVSPWSNDIQTFDRSGGGSPFRRVSPASQFEVFATENPLPGNGYGDFYEAFGLDKESRPIPTKWDEMFGEGSFDALNGDYPSFRSMQSLFVDAGDGKVGLDMMQLDQISSRDSQNPEANDTYDKTLKMLSVIQELSGKTFMVHRGHNPEDPRIPEEPDSVANGVPTPETSSEKSKRLLDFSNFEKVSGPLGSNPGGVYKDPKTGEQYYVKIQDKDRGNNERLASAIYKEAGLGSLEVKDGTLDGKPITYTEWKEGLTPLFGPKANDLGYSKRQEALDSAKDGYLIDAWIANWDIVGEGRDNISTDGDSNPIRLDAGGALLYRARGSRKGSAFGNEVVELETFKDSSNTAELMYGNMYLFPRAERNSYEKLKAISPDRIDQLVDQYISNPDDNKELKDKLKARRQFILDKYENSYLLTGSESKLYGSKTTQNISKEDKKAVNNYTNAGHRYINKYLRDPENPEYQKSKESAEKLNNIIKDNTLIEDTTLLRVTGNFDEDYQPGDIIEDAGIQSTTKVGRSAIHSTVMAKLYPGDPEAAEFLGYTTYTIKAPAGTPALDVTDMSQFRSEGEVLLPAGTKFKVVSYERKPVSEFGGSYRNITVEVVSGEESEKTDTEEPASTSKIDTTGTRLSSDSREGLDSLISNFNLIDNEASSQAYRDVASELGRPISLPWDDERTPEGRETYEYIYSAKRFKKTIPENSEEAELIRIKNLFKENLDNNKNLQEAKKTLASNKLYKDLSDALNSEINDFDEDDISFALMDMGRNLSRPRPRINEDEVEDFSITTPDFNDDEINSQVYDVTVDVEESAEITNRDLKEFSESAAVSIILPSRALEEVLNEGRMKTVHETKYSLAGESSERYRALRVGYESLAFGYNGDSPMEERPVYGLLRSETLPMPEDALMIYGGRNPAQIILKPEAKSRTTISDRDSLNHFEPTTPLSDPKFEPSYITQMVAVYRKGTGENFFETENFAKYGSIEAQVHGGVKLEDIGKVLFYETPSEEMRELLTSKGIIWEVSRNKPYSKPRSYGGGMF